jgi:hypothetical protein
MIIRPNDESLDADDGDYIAGSTAAPETEEERNL